MGIIGIIGLIIQVIRLLPDIFRLIRQIIDLTKSLKGTRGFSEKEILGEFAEALREAKDTKSTAGLEALHKKLSMACAGDSCGV